MVVMVMMMLRGAKRRRSKYHKEQGCRQNFLHGLNRSTMLVAAIDAARLRKEQSESKKETGFAIEPSFPPRRKAA
jgi:hypothetical protein